MRKRYNELYKYNQMLLTQYSSIIDNYYTVAAIAYEVQEFRSKMAELSKLSGNGYSLLRPLER